MQEFKYTIKDELGIHARPAGLLVKAAKASGASISIEKGGKKVDATKLMAVMSLGVKKGETVTVSCEGDNGEQAAADMKAFFEANL